MATGGRRTAFRLFQLRTELSQEAFGAQYGIGSQGMVWQYLKGYVPLNLEAAAKFAAGLGVELRDISPRLADKLSALAQPPPGAYSARQDGSQRLRYELHAQFPELTDADIAELLHFARWRADQRRNKG